MSHNEIAEQCRKVLEEKGFTVGQEFQDSLYTFSQIAASAPYYLQRTLSSCEGVVSDWFCHYLINRAYTDKKLLDEMARQGKNLWPKHYDVSESYL